MLMSMEQPAIIEARDTNTIMLPFVTNFNNAHPATIIIASPAIAAAITAQEGRNQQLIATGVSSALPPFGAHFKPA